MFRPLVRLQGFVRRGSFACAALVSMAVVAACGSSKPAVQVSPSARAQSVVRETFGARRLIQSGVLTLTLTLTPTSAAGADPVSVNLEGPFQSRGAHRPPAFDFDVSISPQSKTASLSLISTGTAAYVTSGGRTYRLPGSSVRGIESIFSAATTPGWLRGPRIVGTDHVAGVATTQIHAGVDVDKLAADAGTLLANASSLDLPGQVGTLPVDIASASRRQLVSAIRAPSLDLWSASSDRTLRKLSLSFDFTPPAGLASKLGSGSTAVALTLQFSGVNQRQQIIAPDHALPFGALQAESPSIADRLVPGTTPPIRAIPRVSTPPKKAHAKPAGPQELTLSPYAQCISNAAPDVAKMQRCASLSNGASPPIHQQG